MTPPPAVDYIEGMFSNEPLGEYSIFSFVHELESACYHEASHAVIDYMFGRSLVSVGVKASIEPDDDGLLTVGYGGEVRTKGPDRVRVDFDYRRRHFIIGCVSAAGPAGERRYRHEVGLPMRLLGASEGDHSSIDTIAKALELRGRDRYAYRRLVWYHAQKLIAQQAIWDAISDVAAELYNDACFDLDVDSPGEHWAYIEPRSVYWHCRRAGLRQGMLAARQ